MSGKRLLLTMTALLIGAVLIGACAQPSAPEVIVQTVVVPGPAAAQATAPAEVEPVTVMANWGGDEEAGFREVLDAFTAKTGIPYIYEGTRNLGVLVRSRIAGGNPPDVAMIPRPGEVAEFARQGAILPLDGVRGD